MDIFRRKTKATTVTQTAPVAEEGNANIAKQVRTSTLHVEPQPRMVVESTQHLETIDEGSTDQPIYQFETTVRPNVKRSRGWFIIAAVFFSGVVAVNVVLQLYMSAVVTALLALLVITSAARKVERITVRITARGIQLGQQFHPWSEFEKFWVLYEPPTLKQLHLKRRARVINELVIELGEQHPLKIRDLLLPLLPEDPHKEESRVDLVTRTLKL